MSCWVQQLLGSPCPCLKKEIQLRCRGMSYSELLCVVQLEPKPSLWKQNYNLCKIQHRRYREKTKVFALQGLGRSGPCHLKDSLSLDEKTSSGWLFSLKSLPEYCLLTDYVQSLFSQRGSQDLAPLTNLFSLPRHDHPTSGCPVPS